MVKTLQLKLVLLLCLLVVGVSNAWADTYTIGWGTASGDNSKNFDAAYGTVSGVLSFTSSKNNGTTTPTYNSNNQDLRLYYDNSGNGNGGSITITPASGVTITGFVMTTSTSPSVNYTVDDETATSVSASSNTYTISGISASSSLKIQNVNTTNTQLRIKTIEVTYISAAPAYTITAQSNNESYGTVSLSGSVITGSPKSGYRYADPAYTVSPANSATVSQDGNAFTVTPSANTTVTINFEAIPCYTVTLGDDNSTLTETTAGAGVTLPTRSAIGGYTFAGWSETNVSTETTTAPTIIPVGTYYPTANITLYPVYTKAGGGAAAPSAFSVGNTGDYAIVSAAQNGKYYALPVQPTVNNGKITAQEITVSESNGVKYVTTADASGFTWTIATASYGYTLSDGTNYFYHSNGGTSGTNVAYGDATDKTWAFTADGDYITFTGMSSATSNNTRGMLFNGTTIGGYSLTNANSSGYYKVMILPISAGTTTYYWSNPVAATVETPVITVEANPFVISTTATITCATEGATIKYSYDNSTWSDYSAALTITETKTIYAKAIKGSDESVVASVEVTKNLANPTVSVSGDLTLDLDGGTDISAGTLTAAVTYNNAAVAGATVTWSSSDTNIATIDASTGAVTIKTTGEVTFTATYAGNSDYAEATGTKTVTVIDSNAPIVGTITFGNNGTKINAASVTGDDSNDNEWTITTVGTTSYTQNTSYSQVGKSAEPATSITFTMTLPAARTITSFTANFGGFSGTTGDVTLKVGNAIVGMGSLNASNDVTVTNSSSAIGTTLTVTVTGIDKGVKCYSISYTIAEATTVPVTIKSGFPATTFSADCALDFTSVSGITAYIITNENGSTTEVTQVPANTGLYIEGTAGTYNVPVIASADPLTVTNLLEPTTGSAVTNDGSYTYYVYGKQNNHCAFYKVDGSYTPSVNKAVLKVETPPTGGAKDFIDVNGGATSIDNLQWTIDNSGVNGIYDLQGRRVAQPTKGIYIVNGRKYIVK